MKYYFLGNLWLTGILSALLRVITRKFLLWLVIWGIVYTVFQQQSRGRCKGRNNWSGKSWILKVGNHRSHTVLLQPAGGASVQGGFRGRVMGFAFSLARNLGINDLAHTWGLRGRTEAIKYHVLFPIARPLGMGGVVICPGIFQQTRAPQHQMLDGDDSCHPLRISCCSSASCCFFFYDRLFSFWLKADITSFNSLHNIM